MIFTKYILKEIFRNQLIILTLLFSVCFCQKLIKILELVIDGNISIYLILLCLGLNMPEIGKLLIPFSVFLSVLVTFYRLHAHNEIIAMYSCAADKYIFIKSIFFFSGIVTILAAINVAWLSPYCSNYQSKLLYRIKENINLAILSEKKFQPLATRSLTLFTDHIQKNKLKHVFLIKKNHDKDSNLLTIITSNQGYIYQKSNGSQLIILEKGRYYEIHNKCDLSKDIFITDFSQYKILIDSTFKKVLNKEKAMNHMSMYQLWHASTPKAHIELHWRLTLLVSIFVIPMITILLIVTISYNYLLNFLLTIFLYITFFLLHILLRFSTFFEEKNLIIWMWIINGIYLLIALLLNSWDNSRIKKFILTAFS